MDFVQLFQVCWGSPPRVRGKDVANFSQELVIGITPACAGKRRVLYAVSGAGEDHPRVCGEKSLTDPGNAARWGSPPRVRGKVRFGLVVCRAVGITPACAGKRQPSTACTWSSWDHPRVCGEKAAFHAWLCCIRGSPPRVRGKEARGELGGPLKRITPACAGKRTKYQLPRGHFQDHPRVCGEKKWSRVS